MRIGTEGRIARDNGSGTVACRAGRVGQNLELVSLAGLPSVAVILEAGRAKAVAVLRNAILDLRAAPALLPVVARRFSSSSRRYCSAHALHLFTVRNLPAPTRSALCKASALNSVLGRSWSHALQRSPPVGLVSARLSSFLLPRPDGRFRAL